jgi:hypothetical protein
MEMSGCHFAVSVAKQLPFLMEYEAVYLVHTTAGLHLPGIEPQFLGLQGCIVVTKPSALFRLVWLIGSISMYVCVHCISPPLFTVWDFVKPSVRSTNRTSKMSCDFCNNESVISTQVDYMCFEWWQIIVIKWNNFIIEMPIGKTTTRLRTRRRRQRRGILINRRLTSK